MEFDRTVIGSAWRSRPKALSLLVCSFALLSIAEVTCGAGEYLVQDLGQLIRFPPSDIGIPLSVVIDDVAYFFRNDGAHGHELWRSDGTPLGTYLMMDVCPGICGAESVGSSGARMTSVGSSLYFAANDGVHGTELWITDGTPVGTRMVADIWPGPESSGISAMGSAGGIVFFGANDGVHGPELWRSNGTASGTWLVAELTPGPYGEGLHSIDGVQGRIYVRGGNRIWASDGTSAGTTLLSENAAYSESSSSRGAAHRVLPSGLLLFVGCQSEPTQQDCELWRSDGTSAGTMLLADLNPGPQSSNPQGFEPFGEEIWFTAIRQISPQASAWRLFRTDGSISGTVEVVLPGGVTPETHWSRAIGAMNRFYFTGIDADHGAEPWVTDGVTSTMLLDVRPGPKGSLDVAFGFDRPIFSSLGDAVLFVAEDGSSGPQLWRSDGTGGSTVPISDFDDPPEGAFFGGYQSRAYLPEVAGRLVLSLFRSDRGLEIWTSDGTSAGTSRLRTLGESTSAFTRPTSIFYSELEVRCTAPWRQGAIYAPAFLATEDAGEYIYFDGVPGGGEPLLSWSFGASDPPECASTGGDALLVRTGQQSSEIWRTNGSAAGTSALFTFPEGSGGASRPGFGAFRGSMFLASSDDEVLRFDPDSSNPMELATTVTWGRFAATQERLFFGGGGLEVSNGLADPTPLIDSQTSGFVQVEDMAEIGEALFFSGWTSAEGNELWRSDGTLEGTARVRSLRPGAPSGLPDRRPTDYWGFRVPEARIAPLGEGSVVFPGNDGATGFELWTSDGTAAGTVVVADIAPGPDGSWPRHLVSLGNSLVLFAAEHPKHGYELFRTDGTAAGTSMVRDLVVGAGSSVPDDFVVQDGVLYFSAWTPSHGREAWRSDGTFAGTYRLTDVAPGPLSSSPSRFVLRGNRLFFTATDHVHGFELWARADDGSVPLFIDGFETGDAGRWSAQNP